MNFFFPEEQVGRLYEQGITLVSPNPITIDKFEEFDFYELDVDSENTQYLIGTSFTTFHLCHLTNGNTIEFTNDANYITAFSKHQLLGKIFKLNTHFDQITYHQTLGLTVRSFNVLHTLPYFTLGAHGLYAIKYNLGTEHLAAIDDTGWSSQQINDTMEFLHATVTELYETGFFTWEEWQDICNLIKNI